MREKVERDALHALEERVTVDRVTQSLSAFAPARAA
jgi:hypothetical protein